MMERLLAGRVHDQNMGATLIVFALPSEDAEHQGVATGSCEGLGVSWRSWRTRR